MERIILFYRFCSLAEPDLVRLWQLELCRRLNLRGRVILASSGINATLGGRLADLLAYKRALNDLPALRGIDYKWSDGLAADFPKLSVKVRPELVTLEPERAFDSNDARGALDARQWHEYLKANPGVLVLDARNEYESELGYFDVPNLVKPSIGSFKEIKRVVAQLPTAEPVLTYCTGDVRCQYLSAYMRSLGFKNVYHLDGGIMKYGQAFGNDGFWRGKCYVFDRRMRLGFSKHSRDLARCLACRQPSSDQVNCDDCNRQLVVCVDCQRLPFRHCRRPTVSSGQRC